MVTPVNKYLVSICCSPDVIRLAMEEDNMESAIEECGWAWRGTGRAERRKARERLEALLSHPKLNTWLPDTGYSVNGQLADRQG